MRNHIVVAAVVGALWSLAFVAASCAPLGSPAAVSDATKADEQAALAVELAYKAARTAAEMAVDLGAVKPGTPLAKRIAAADRTAYAAVLAAREAYEAGNAADYATATRDAIGAVAAFHSSVKAK